MTTKITTTILLFFIIVVGLIACVMQPKIQYYDFPADIAEEAKIANTKRLEKGRVLYNINCAKCHTKKIRRRLVIPDFTTAQLDSYIIRIKNQSHVANLTESVVTSEEMEAIQFFFTYKKPAEPKPEAVQ
ncbi:MAG: hypothetical protein ABIN74_10285 [Ferruginibacter sp.]